MSRKTLSPTAKAFAPVLAAGLPGLSDEGISTLLGQLSQGEAIFDQAIHEKDPAKLQDLAAQQQALDLEMEAAIDRLIPGAW